jgi:hypothetical protein
MVQRRQEGRGPLSARCCDHHADVGQLGSECPGVANRLAVLDQECRALGDVLHPARRHRDAEPTRRLAVPVGEERDVDAECLRPRRVRPDRVPRDAEGSDPDGREVLAPVTQEQDFVLSSRRPVEDVEAEERVTGLEHLP